MPVISPELQPRAKAYVVGTTAVEVSPDMTGSHQRKMISFCNNSTGSQKITIVSGQNAVSGAGIILNVGATHIEAIDAAFKPSNFRWTAIADGAGASLAVYEELI